MQYLKYQIIALSAVSAALGPHDWPPKGTPCRDNKDCVYKCAFGVYAPAIIDGQATFVCAEDNDFTSERFWVTNCLVPHGGHGDHEATRITACLALGGENCRRGCYFVIGPSDADDFKAEWAKHCSTGNLTAQITGYPLWTDAVRHADCL